MGSNLHKKIMWKIHKINKHHYNKQSFSERLTLHWTLFTTLKLNLKGFRWRSLSQGQKHYQFMVICQELVKYLGFHNLSCLTKKLFKMKSSKMLHVLQKSGWILVSFLIKGRWKINKNSYFLYKRGLWKLKNKDTHSSYSKSMKILQNNSWIDSFLKFKVIRKSC